MEAKKHTEKLLEAVRENDILSAHESVTEGANVNIRVNAKKYTNLPNQEGVIFYDLVENESHGGTVKYSTEETSLLFLATQNNKSPQTLEMINFLINCGADLKFVEREIDDDTKEIINETTFAEKLKQEGLKLKQGLFSKKAKVIIDQKSPVHESSKKTELEEVQSL